ncbi:MAG: universal stress protein [Candidatus Dormibacteraceae bacterium]
MTEAGRIMVCAGGNSVDEETMQAACKLALAHHSAPSRAQIYVVHILEVSRSRPLSASTEQELKRADQILERMEQLAIKKQVMVESELVQARETGPALVGEALDWGADLIVMGIPYKRRFGDFNLGKTAPYLLKHAGCRLILLRERLKSDREAALIGE